MITSPPPLEQPRTFVSHGYAYQMDSNGAIHQINPEPFVYDEKYVETYNTNEYLAGSQTLSALRLGFVLGAHGRLPTILLDNGYGNGAFMKFARKTIPYVMGLDVTDIEVEGCHIVKDYRPADVYTFWDCLEHIPDLSFLKRLPCNTICLSLPWCHYRTNGQEWFDNHYHHRKPNEHVHHFDMRSLPATMAQYGWHMTAISNHEDIVRKPKDPTLKNILSAAFKRR